MGVSIGPVLKGTPGVFLSLGFPGCSSANSLWFILFFSLFFGGFFLPEKVFSAPDIVQIAPDIERFALNGALSVYTDDSGKLGIVDIASENLKSQFVPLDGKSSFGYSTAAFWFRFTARNSTVKPIFWYLEYPYAAVDHFEFFHPLNSGFKRYIGGDTHAFAQRPVNFRTMVVPIDLLPGDHSFYFKIQSKGAIVAPAVAWGRGAFERHKNFDAAFNWMYFGAMLVTTIYCFFGFASMKVPAFFFLGVFVFGTAFFTMVHTGMASQYLWPASPFWSNFCHPLSGVLGLLGGLPFTRSFLNTPKYLPVCDRILVGLMLLSFVLGAVFVFLPYGIATQAMVLLIGLSVMTMITCSLVLLVKGLRQARFYLLAWTPFVISAILMVLKSFGFLENNPLTDSMVQVSAAFVAILLSFGLMDKIHAIRQEREIVLGQLHTSETQYRILAENVKDVIWILNLKNLKITYITPSVEDMLGYTPQEAEHFLFREMLPPGSADMAWKAIKDGIENYLSGSGKIQHAFTIELECYNKAKELLWTETTTSFTQDGVGNPMEMVGVSRDITKRKQAEKEKKALEFQLHQSGKLEAIGTLAGGIAHDMNNIVAAIMGYAELSLHEADKNSRMHHRLDRMIKACHRARDLVSQILTFSRQDIQEIRSVKVHLIVKEVLKLIRASLPSTITIQQDIPKQHLMITADPTQVHQIIMNLCSNAGYAMMEKGGVLCVSLEKVAHTAQTFLDLLPGDYVRLTVSDTGQGMEKEVMDRIFEPFFTTKPLGSGTGMGLAMVHGIVKKLGGDIFVDSTPGKGTTFHLFFPTAMGSTPEEVLPEAIVPTGNESILFVDDEENMADMAQEMLTSLGYKVVTKTSSPEALSYFKQNPARVDLVITDQTMPELTGMTLAGKLWEIRPELPVILCTGFNDLVSAESAKNSGIREYILKPYGKRDLAIKIRKTLDSGQ
ncbi:MAG: response regulator [Proteobacteria bacterium]|nr:response regulator [Desulfobacula sp.]MBU3952433.1 response regulator [Pseudomonadota bacterium]MBU4129680.1 response regulator [Pseudomonadota bacterium]